MPVRIGMAQRIVPHIPVQVERLGIAEIGVGDGIGDGAPIRRHPAAHRGGVVPGAEVVQPALGIPFFAGELVRQSQQARKAGGIGQSYAWRGAS